MSLRTLFHQIREIISSAPARARQTAPWHYLAASLAKLMLRDRQVRWARTDGRTNRSHYARETRMRLRKCHLDGRLAGPLVGWMAGWMGHLIYADNLTARSCGTRTSSRMLRRACFSTNRCLPQKANSSRVALAVVPSITANYVACKWPTNLLVA